jgi:VanZ family protein
LSVEIQSTKSPAQYFFLLYWLPVLVWMGIIFYISHQDSDSTGQNGDIFMFLFNLLNLDPVRMVELKVPLYLRKLAHVIEYFVLFLLLARLNFQYFKMPKVAWMSLVVTILYAISDEFHQTFIPGREGKISDVGIDSLGAILALGVLFLWVRWVKKTDSA